MAPLQTPSLAMWDGQTPPRLCVSLPDRPRHSGSCLLLLLTQALRSRLNILSSRVPCPLTLFPSLSSLSVSMRYHTPGPAAPGRSYNPVCSSRKSHISRGLLFRGIHTILRSKAPFPHEGFPSLITESEGMSEARVPGQHHSERSWPGLRSQGPFVGAAAGGWGGGLGTGLLHTPESHPSIFILPAPS